MSPIYSLRSSGRIGAVARWRDDAGRAGTASVAHDGAVFALLVLPAQADSSDAASQQPRLFSASADTRIKVWDVDTMDQLQTLAGHRSFVCALQAARGLLYSASSDNTCAVWRLDTYKRVHVLSGHQKGVYSLAFHLGRLCSGSLDTTVRVWPAVHLHQEQCTSRSHDF